tara:strand:+ start:2315 stop:3427 length:1113 start_codon:yes stop_codon:yes gene_type:complete
MPRRLAFPGGNIVSLKESPSMLWTRYRNGEVISNTVDTNNKLFIHACYMKFEKENEMLTYRNILNHIKQKYNEVRRIEAGQNERTTKLALKHDQVQIAYDEVQIARDEADELIDTVYKTVTPYKCVYTVTDEKLDPIINYEKIFDAMINILIHLKQKSYDREDILVNAITYACVNGNLNALKKLIDKFNTVTMFDIDIYVMYNFAQDSIYEWGDEPRDYNRFEDTTLLHIACYYNHPNIAKYLLDNGCDVNKVNEIGLPPIYYACERGHETVVYKLLNFMDINDRLYITVTDKNLDELSVYTTVLPINGDVIQLSEVVNHNHGITNPLFRYLEELETTLEGLKRKKPTNEPAESTTRKKHKKTPYRQLRL